MKRKCWALLLALLFLPYIGLAEENDAAVYTLQSESGERLMLRAGQIFVDDEYISGDNQLYRVVSVDDGSRVAVARHVGEEPFDDLWPAETAFQALAEEKQSGKKLICMYSTHSDESYEKGDGTSSKTQGAGIYDVGEALKGNLEKLGIQVVYSDATHLPHDAGAYRRSRQTAEELLKQAPDALLDLHRDGIPDEAEYESEVKGEETSKVRLLVGRSNPNADANRAFAKQIKKTADQEYPGLIKDIFVGKGNYNQELYPQSLLLEFGTHTIDKDLAVQATGYMANVLDDVLFGGTAKVDANEGQVKESNAAGAKGIGWWIGLAVVGGLVYLLAATGTFKNFWGRLARGTSEITGGAIGKKPDDER